MQGSPYSETHFNVSIVSTEFGGKSLVQRHRLVYDVLGEELKTGGLHALNITTKTPEEFEQDEKKEADARA
jgi:BolA-like protein 1